MKKVRRGEVEFVFLHHAVLRAEDRSIPWDLIESAIHSGKFHYFGKNMVKINKKFQGGLLTCVCKIVSPTEIKVITIEFG